MRVVGTLPHAPLVPGSVKISAKDRQDAWMVAKDDGAGKLTGDIQGLSAAVDYTTGMVDFVFARPVKKDAPITADFARYMKVKKFVRGNVPMRLSVSIPWADFLKIYSNSVKVAASLQERLTHRPIL
jgi:hypothetical protein